jgi:hypothetical protein
VYFLSLSLSHMYESKGFCHLIVGIGTKEDESSTVHIWAAGFHHVTDHSRLASIWKLMNCLFLYVENFFRAQYTTYNRNCGY